MRIETIKQSGRFVTIALQSLVVACAFQLSNANASDGDSAVGAVYTMTNSSSGNAILAFDRKANGMLTAAGSYPTGGTGTGAGLGNQGAVVLSENNRWLYVVNAGSNDISVFAVRPDGLKLTDRVDAGGLKPVSLAVDRELVYVLNAGGNGNISGFSQRRNGHLEPLAGSARTLSGAGTGPAQISFNPDGHVLVVTEKATNLIDTYLVDGDGLTSGPQPQSSVGTTPFGFSFDKRGHLLVSEAAGGASDAGSLSSYSVDENGVLEVISASVPTTETAICWVVVTKNSKFAYVSNAGSGSLSAYRIAQQGTITLRDADGRTANTGTGSTPIDIALSNDSHFIYTLNAGTHTLGAFEVQANGALAPMTGIDGIAVGANGLAAY